jgi:cell division protein FtsL
MAAARRQATSSAPAAAAPEPHRLLQGRAGIALLALVLVSCFALIQSTHQCRQLYARLQELEAARWYLDEEYSRLLLEQSTWASPYRVEQVAGRDLHMAPPQLEQLRVVPR